MDGSIIFGILGIAVAVLSIISSVLTIFGVANIALAAEIGAGVMLILMLINAVSFLRR